jgi:hypothetical protein
VSDVEESLYNSVITSALAVIELEKKSEENNPALQSIEKEVAPVKGKSKGKKVVRHAFSQDCTRSYTKASIQRIVAPSTTVVGSPTATPSTRPPILLLLVPIWVQPSHLCLTRGRLLHRIFLRLRRRGHLVFD